MDMTIITLISCAIVIFISVFSYERKISRITKYNQLLARDNMKLIDAVESLMRAGNELAISYEALYKLAKERFEDEEIRELFDEKFKLVAEKHAERKDTDDGR
jgi:hypothetical protein